MPFLSTYPTLSKIYMIIVKCIWKMWGWLEQCKPLKINHSINPILDKNAIMKIPFSVNFSCSQARLHTPFIIRFPFPVLNTESPSFSSLNNVTGASSLLSPNIILVLSRSRFEKLNQSSCFLYFLANRSYRLKRLPLAKGLTLLVSPLQSFPKLNTCVCIWVWQTIPLDAPCWPPQPYKLLSA